MKIIDAHLHFHNNENFNALAKAVGHENTETHLREYFRKENIVHGIVMGNEGFKYQEYPDFLSYCVGMDKESIEDQGIAEAISSIEDHLRRKNCVGIKIYAGYSKGYVSDPIYYPVYELALKYEKPVAIHTGVTAGHSGLLKYSHPLTIDEAASMFPKVQFIMCHFGNPWVMDAAAVMDKNENVAMDLSGILENHIKIPQFFQENKDYVSYLRAALQFLDLDHYERIMYGTDWPLVNLTEYLKFVQVLVPEKFHDKVFYDNAKKFYHLDL